MEKSESEEQDSKDLFQTPEPFGITSGTSAKHIKRAYSNIVFFKTILNSKGSLH